MNSGALNERFEMRCPRGWNEAVETAAAKAGVDRSVWVRAAVSAALHDDALVESVKVRTLPLPVPIPTDGRTAAELLARVATATATGELDKGIASSVTQALNAYLRSGLPAAKLAAAARDFIAMILVHADVFASMSVRKYNKFFGGQWRKWGGEGPLPLPGDYHRCTCKTCKGMREAAA